MKTKTFPLALAGAALGLGLALSGCQRAAESGFDQKIHAYLLAHPDVVEEALQKSQDLKAAKADADARDAIRVRMDQLEHDPRDFVANPGGKVTVVEFFDYRCPYCKAALPDLMSLINQDKDVRFVFKEFPILDNEGKPGVSKRAALAAMASQGSGKYLQMHNAMMGTRALDDPDIVRALRDNGIDPATALKDTPQADKRLADNLSLATAVGVTGTPSFEVNGKLVSGADMAALIAAISDAKKAKG
ncbi:MAG TPA: DsbA family protein [Caulobacteraceae bacterium]|nr:DsbA family protein [Caulobacteraceae bacterium]